MLNKKQAPPQTDVEEAAKRRNRSKSDSSSFSQSSRGVGITRGRRRGRINNKQNSTILEADKRDEDSNVIMASASEHSGYSSQNEKQLRMLRNQNQPLVAANNSYDAACQKLQLNAIPDQLPCRDSERAQIIEYIVNGLQNKGSSSSLYISGMPGTGKTATTLEVIKSLLSQRKYKFDFLHINAMSLTNPNLVYTIMYESIVGRRVAPANAALFLDEFFKKRDKQKIYLNARNERKRTTYVLKEADKACKKMRVVLIDELDALVTQKQTLLYNLFDWPCHQNSRLLVISIANTMDLPERMQGKIQSRIGQNRLVYEPYNQQQILTILRSRLADVHDIFEGKSLDFVARKVSMYSGDIRRSLQITKRSVEVCRDRHIAKKLPKGAPITKVIFSDVIEAFSELFNSKTVHVLQTLQRRESLATLAILSELISQKKEKVLIDDCLDRFNSMQATLR